MPTSLGSYIRELRQKKNLTLRQLSEKVDMDFTYLSKVENNRLHSHEGKKYSVSAENLKELAAVLDGDFATMQLLAGKMLENVLSDASKKPKAAEFFRAIPKDGLSEAQWEDLLNRIHSKKKK